MSERNLHRSILLISALLFVLLAVSPVSGFCPANVIQSSSYSCYACYKIDNNDPNTPNCKACHDASCCIARCYPDCYVPSPSGCEGVSCSCDSSVNSGEPQLTLITRSDIGQDEVSILISAWEPGIPNQQPVPGVVLSIQVADSSGNRPFSTIPETTYGLLTGNNGEATLQWKWDPRDAGKSWNVDIEGSRPGYLAGYTSTMVLCPLPTDELKVSIDEKECAGGQCYLETKVIAIGSEEPVPYANVEFRVWNSQYSDYSDWGPYSTNSMGILTVRTTPGVWRIDVYASKEGYTNEDWSNIYDVCGGSFCSQQSYLGTSLIGVIPGMGTAANNDSVKIGTPSMNETVTQSTKSVHFPLSALFLSLIIALVMVVLKGSR